jgi:pyruvate-ferredoxin/flavodoxin oxidoreductase
MRNETRFRMAEKIDPARFRRLIAAAQTDAVQRHALYSQLAGITIPQPEPEAGSESEPAAEPEE